MAMNDASDRQYAFRPAVRENVGLFVGLAGESGSGKTWTAMELATGIVGPGERFSVIDTENKRALHYADFFAFDVLELTPPYSADRYEGAVVAAVKAGYKAIVLDSASHEHDGEGGYLDQQAKDLEERVARYMKKYPDSKEFDVREKLTPSSWIEPKKKRKRMIQTLLACSTSIPIIFCFRAEEKVFTSKDGKLVAHNPPLWAPVCGKGMPYEMTAFFLMRQMAPGVIAAPLKLQEQHRELFPIGKPLTRESGRRIAEWAAGKNSAPLKTPEPARAGTLPPSSSSGAEPAYITADQVKEIEALCKKGGVPVAKLLTAGKVEKLEQLLVDDYDRATNWVKRQPRAVDSEASAILKIDRAKDRDEAADILESMREEPYYAKASEAYVNRWINAGDRL